jgi:hypothetical protein
VSSPDDPDDVELDLDDIPHPIDDRLERGAIHEVEFEAPWIGQDSDPKTILGHGITLDDRAKMYRDQGGECAICGRLEAAVGQLEIDHDHTPGGHGVRGLLCHRCNSGIGLFDDNPVVLEAAARYLWDRGCWLNKPLTEEERGSHEQLEAAGIIGPSWRTQGLRLRGFKDPDARPKP